MITLQHYNYFQNKARLYSASRKTEPFAYKYSLSVPQLYLCINSQMKNKNKILM